MDDLSIMIKIGGQLEKSFDDAIRDAQNGLSGLNATISKEMAKAGNISSASAMEMRSSGRMFSEAFGEMASAGKMGASASREMASGGMTAAASFKGMIDAGGGTASTFMEMAVEGKKAADAVRDIASTGKITSSSVRDIASAVKGAVTGFKDMSTQAGKASKDLQMAGGDVTSLSTDLAASGKGIFNLSKDLGKAGELAGAASKGFLIAGAAIASTAAVAAAAAKVMKEVAEYSIQVGKEFEASMSDAAATADASAEDFGKMEQAAMEMGRTTSKTASESANALEYMALAGWDVDTSISALPSVLKMSEASGMELGRTSDLVTDSMAALGVTVDQLPGYLDVAAKAQTKSNQSTEQLMEAYIGVGGTMKNLGIPSTESATALGVLANRGIKGSEAGNALNAVMVNLTTGTGQAGKMMQSLGVSAFDQQGKFIGLEETLQQLNTSLQGCSEEQRNAALAAIGGKQHIDALNSLMAGLNTTNEEGISEWAALTNELENCNGSLQKMRDMKLDNLEGDLKTLESATQDAGIKIYKHLNTPLRDFTQFGTRAVSDASAALEAGGFSEMAMSAGSSFADGLGMVVERLPEFLAKAAVGTVSFLVGFITELPASLLKGIIKGVPRLIKALPGIGVDIVKAIIKGVLSMGSAPLKAIVGLFLDGKDNAEDMEKAGADAVTGDTADTKEEMAATAIPSAPPQKIGIKGTDMMGTALPVKQKGIPPTGLDSSIAGQGVDIPDLDIDTSATVDPRAEDKKPEETAAWRVPDTPLIDTAQPVNQAEMPPAADTAPILQGANLKVGIPEGLGMEMPAGGSVLGDIPAEGLLPPGEGIGAYPPTNTGGVQAGALQIPDIGEPFSVPSADAVHDITPMLQVEMMDSSTEAARTASVLGMGASTEDTQILPSAMPDMDVEAAQVYAGAVPDMAGAQIPTGSIPAPAGIEPNLGQMGGELSMEGAPAEPQSISSETAIGDAGSQYAEKIPIGNAIAPHQGGIQTKENQIPPIRAIMASVGNAIHTSIEGSLAGRMIGAVKTNANGATFFSSQYTGGTEKRNEGTAVSAQEGIGITMAGIGGAAQMLQIPPKGTVQTISENAFQDMAPGAANIQATTNNTGNMPPLGISPGMGILPAAEAVAQEPVGDTGAAGDSDMEPLPKRSLIDEVLDILLGKRREQEVPVPDTPPSFVYSPTFNIESGGDLKKDVEEASQMGMREFDKMMQQWMKQNKRKAFA